VGILPRAPQPCWLEQDLQSELLRAALLEQLDRAVEIDVVPNGDPPGRTGLVPRPFERFRTPPLDSLDLCLL
jgi:hypothetical protein